MPFEEIVALKVTNPMMSNRELGKLLGIGETSVRRGLAKAQDAGALPVISKKEVDALMTPLELTGDWVIAADWHIPITDWHLANSMVVRAKREGIRQLLIPGDFWNMDSLSRFDPKQDGAGLEAERQAGLRTMDELLTAFDRVVLTWGNHDDRLVRQLGFKVQFETAMSMMFGPLGTELLSRITYSGLDHAWLWDSPNGWPWYVCHPQSYTRVPLSNARQLAVKHNANVIVAHSHHAAMGVAVDGEKVCIEAGGLFDQYRTAYLQRSTTYPTWANGYVFVKGGVANLYSPVFGTA